MNKNEELGWIRTFIFKSGGNPQNGFYVVFSQHTAKLQPLVLILKEEGITDAELLILTSIINITNTSESGGIILFCPHINSDDKTFHHF